MKIAICDDEKPFLDKLYQILQEIRMELNIPISIIKFIDGKELLNYFEVHKDIDVFILDILMNPINGYDVARKFRKMDNKVKLVFLTSIKNYAIAGYNIRLEKYILKPVSKKVMSKVILEIYNQLYRNGKFLIVKNVEGLFKLYFEDIYFIETEDKHVLIHTKDSSVKCYHCLKLLEDKLDTNFYRCHASFIVNLLHIDTYERLEIKLENNFHIPVSKHRKSGFTEKLLDFYARYME